MCDHRLNELRLLKLKLGESRRELHILKNSVANIDILKHEVHCLGRELLQERTKVKALSEELENPLNVHRCPPTPPKHTFNPLSVKPSQCPQLPTHPFHTP